MFEVDNLANLIITAISFVIAGGYLVIGLMLYRQVTILCRILETDLSSLIKLSAVVHILLIATASLIVFRLI